MLALGHFFFRQSKITRYTLALLTIAAAVAFRTLIDPWVGNHILFAPIFFAIIFIGWAFGTGPGLMAIALGFLGVNYLFVEPRHAESVLSVGNIADTISYFLTSLGALWIIHVQRTTHQRAVKEEQLGRNRLTELETLYQQAPIGLCFTDRHHRYVRINDHLAEFSDYSAEGHIGRTVWEMVPQLEPILRPMLERILATGQPVDNYEFHASSKAGPREQWWLCSYHPVRDREGRILGINTTAMEITDLKQAEHRLQQRVRERTAELESFTNSVAHDLRAPVRGIASFTQLALEDSGPAITPHNRELLQNAIRAAERMDRLILDLLALSNVSQRELQQKIVNLSHLADSIVAQIRKENPRRSTRTHFDITSGLTVCGDEHFLRLALENLLDNAWKFTSIHAHSLIEFGTEQRDGETVYYIRDDGIGFDMTHAGRLFGIFERLHNADQYPTSATSTGIGLALVKRIIARHDGRIWAASTPGHGATFYFTLGQGPCQTRDLPELMVEGIEEKKR